MAPEMVAQWSQVRGSDGCHSKRMNMFSLFRQSNGLSENVDKQEEARDLENQEEQEVGYVGFGCSEPESM